MTRVDADKYSVLIRSDYLYALGQLSGNRQERDTLIREAIESFLTDYPFQKRSEEIQVEQGRVRIMFPVGHRHTYHMYLEFVRLPDELVELMDMSNRYPNTNTPCFDSLGTVLNAAIRMFLEKNHPEFLTDRVHNKTPLEVTDHA